MSHYFLKNLKSNKKQEDLVEEIETASESLGLGDRYYSRAGVRLEDKYGLCATCRNKILIKTKYDVKLFKCGEEDMPLSMENPVIECTAYEKIGSLTLRQMASIAHIIEIDNKMKPGF